MAGNEREIATCQAARLLRPCALLGNMEGEKKQLRLGNMEGEKKQLRLSTKSKGIPRSVKNCSKTRCHGEVFIEDVLHPSGIMNTALNCYINAVIQCLFNLPQFQDIARELHRVHPGKCDHTCQQKSKHTLTKKTKNKKRY